MHLLPNAGAQAPPLLNIITSGMVYAGGAQARPVLISFSIMVMVA
jgi:hypothetical protein